MAAMDVSSLALLITTRAATELTADYLANPNANSKAEAIRNFIKNLNDVLAGARGQSEIADDLTSDKTMAFVVTVSTLSPKKDIWNR